MKQDMYVLFNTDTKCQQMQPANIYTLRVETAMQQKIKNKINKFEGIDGTIKRDRNYYSMIYAYRFL